MKYLLYFLLSVVLICSSQNSYKAFVKEIGINCLCEPVKSFGKTAALYTHMSYSYDTVKNECPRSLQLPYLSVVTVLSEPNDDGEVKIQTQIYYENTEGPSNIFWTQATFLAKVTEEKKPFLAYYTSDASKKIILEKPFRTSINGKIITFCAGTHFKLANSYNLTTVKEKINQKYTVYVYNAEKDSFETLIIPEEAIFKPISTNPRLIYVAALKQLGKIPLAWGGNLTDGQEPLSGEEFQAQTNGTVFGCDTSGIAVLAKMITGLGGPLRNTTMREKYQKHLALGEKLQPADFIFITDLDNKNPWTCIVLSLNPFTLIGARSYSGGFGYAKAMNVSDYFTDVRNAEEMEEAYFQNKTIHFIKNNTTKETIPVKVTILVFESTEDEKEELQRLLDTKILISESHTMPNNQFKKEKTLKEVAYDFFKHIKDRLNGLIK